MRIFPLLLIALLLTAPVSAETTDAEAEIWRANAAVVTLHRQEKDAEGLALAQEAHQRAETTLGPDHPMTLSSLNNLAGLYQSQGRYAEAEPLFERVLERSRATLGEDHPNTLASLDNLAGLYQSQGRYAKAEPLHKQALGKFRATLGEDHPDTLTSLNSLAVLYKSQGRYAEAEPLYKRVLERSRATLGEEHQHTLATLNNLAALYQSQGRYAEAELLYNQALEKRRTTLGEDDPDTLISLNNLAGLYTSQGRYAEAEPLFRRALERHRAIFGEDHLNTLISLNNLAGLYQSQGRYAEAEPLVERALERTRATLGEDHQETLFSLNNLAVLYSSSGRRAEAEPLFERALQIMETRAGDHPNTLGLRGNLAVLRVRLGKMTPAVQLFRKNDDSLARWLTAQVGSTAAAQRRRHIFVVTSGYQDAGLSLALRYPSAETAEFAADLVLRWKKRLTQDAAILHNIARVSKDPDIRGTVARVREAEAALSNVAFNPAVPSDEKTRRVEALEAAEADLRQRSAAYRRFQDVRSARAAEVQRALPATSALIEYRIFNPYDFETGKFGPYHLLAVVVRPRGSPVPVDLGEAGPLVLVQTLLSSPRLRKANNQPFDFLARVADARLIAPLLLHLDGVDTLYISPDGSLNALPFGALTDADGQRLVERFALHMLQTGRDLVARDRPATGKGLVALGGLDYGPRPAGAGAGETEVASAASESQTFRLALSAARDQIGAFKPLPQTRREVDTIAEAYRISRPGEPAPRVLRGAEGTEAVLQSLPAPPRVLHLATHGFYLASGSVPDRPLMQSGVALSGANRAFAHADRPQGGNGILHALEAQGLNLYGTELVVLSACDTGQGTVDYSEGLEGLPRAFYVAGAQNVLVALWPVGDGAAATFMGHFYNTWLSQEVSNPARALRDTKLYFLHHGTPAERAPDFWAPFVLFEG